jgi:hypothetical protein
MTITLNKDGGTKILAKESGLVAALLAKGWKKEAAKKKEVKEVKANTTEGK